MHKLKVLLVDDSSVYRNIIKNAVEATGLAEVGNVASNGALAIERMEINNYDVVLLDVNMPQMDGIQALEIIKRKWNKTPVIMISGTGGKQAEITIKALEKGAMDFIVKPAEENYNKNMEIVKNHLKVLFAQIKIENKRFTDFKITENNVMKKEIKNEAKTEFKKTVIKNSISPVDIILIASSTGGPVALEKIFQGFGHDFRKKILVVQHMPPDFTKVLAETLDKKSLIKFCEANNNQIIRSGMAVIASGGYHLEIKKDVGQYIALNTKGDFVKGVRPSADVLFRSVARELNNEKILVIILTGMGSDGVDGLKELKQKQSCYCITQSEKSCVVYGMPRAVDEAGLSDERLDIEDIPKRMQEIIKYGS
jgi:two-component system chemotaxis response regulator CheB